MTNLQMIVALVTSPGRAFEEMAQKPRWLFPLLLLLVPSLLLALWYYSKVDVAWLIDEQLRGNPQTAQMPEAQRAQVAQFMTRGTLMWTSLLAVLFIVPLFRVLEATWYTLAGKVMNVDRGFRQWFSLANWTSLPGVLAVIPAAISLLLASGNQIDPGVLQPLSLNELFFHRSSGEPGYQLLANLGLLQVVGAVLAIIGVRTWSKRSWLFSSLFVLLPALVLLACVLLFAARS